MNKNALILSFVFLLTFISVNENVFSKNVEINQSIYFSSEIKCFPNPFIDKIHVSLNSLKNQDVLIKIFGQYGKMVYNETVSLDEGENELILEPHLHQGIYYLSVELENHQFLTHKIRKVEDTH